MEGGGGRGKRFTLVLDSLDETSVCLATCAANERSYAGYAGHFGGGGGESRYNLVDFIFVSRIISS